MAHRYVTVATRMLPDTHYTDSAQLLLACNCMVACAKSSVC